MPRSHSDEPSEDFRLDIVEESLGETHDESLADAISDALHSPRCSSLDLVSRLRAILARDAERRAEDATLLFAATLRCVVCDIEAAGRKAARAARYHRMAFGFRHDSEESMRAVARAQGVSVEAVSKSVAAIRSKHRLALNSFNKSASASDKYRESNRRKIA